MNDSRWEKAGAAARTIVGAVLIASSLSKLLGAPEDFAAVIENYRLLPLKHLLFFAKTLPVLEFALGLTMITGFYARTASAAAGGFLLMFIGALGSTILRGIEIENCGCFGGGIHLTPPQAIGLDSLLLCLSYLGYRFGGAYAAYNSHFTGADRVFAMPHARIAVMGPGGGLEFVFKTELRQLEAEYKRAIQGGTSAQEAGRVRDAALAKIRDQYERQLLNPKEALALGSVSSLVMPGTSRRVLGRDLNFLMRTYEPSAMAGPQREFE